MATLHFEVICPAFTSHRKQMKLDTSVDFDNTKIFLCSDFKISFKKKMKE